MLQRILLACLAFCTGAAPVAAQETRIDAEVERVIGRVTELRHRIHQYP